MRRACAWIGWALCVCASVSVCAQDDPEDDGMIPEDGTQPERGGAGAAAEFLKSNKAAWRMPGQFLVILHQDTHESQVQRTIRRLRARAARRGHPVQVLQTYSGALRGFLVQMSREALQLAVTLPHVHFIEEDSYIFAQSAPWNLQRLLQPYGGIPQNGTYKPPNDGGMAEVYLMDGSIQSSHREVEGRVLITDFNNVPEEDGVRVHKQASQCDSHGTHLAGVVIGSDSGVARGAGVNLVRVLNCQGKGTVSGALAGMEYIGVTLQARPVEALVVLLPFIGGFSRSLNAACRELVSHGAVVIAAAGNHRDDACLYSPASEPEVITVGAVNSADQLMSQGAGGSNYGRCVDVFAPGDDIVSASSDCSTCFTSRSGTSQAAAHAAGIAAVILSSNQNVSPVQVLQMMLHYSISNTINLLPLPETLRLPTPNLVSAMPSIGDLTADRELLCRSVWSERSGRGRGDVAASRCRQGEQMMSCSSVAPDGAGVGESISMRAGHMECVAHNGPSGNGVYAVARCCVMGGLTCQPYAGSEPGREAQCAESQQHLSGHSFPGCTAHSPAELLLDSRPHPKHRRRCTAREGVTSQAVCCHAPSLECRLLETVSLDTDQVELSCLSGWTLTDCKAITEGSTVVEPVATGNSCLIRGAAGGNRIAGVAACCRVTPERDPETKAN
ncbi:proprotein convertase subtilisin/kexin type 9 isoform X1 [Oryzias latipes]|uniref:proprotein convertase subtilisin/kexin type 9 isoform X1 n=1 Tax=Oryzias latipes TaxID=8090 RepID=UPI0002A49E7B|nr:proprotein convertase subtilisin/kexin type 9 isoform X1 [Oryzias latipes]